MPRPRNRKSKPKDEEVSLKRASKTKAQDHLKEESGSSEPGSPKSVTPAEPPPTDVTDDDDFNSSTIVDMLKGTKYTSEDEEAYKSFMFNGPKYPTLADVVKEDTKDPSKRLTDSEMESDELKIYKGLAKYLADYSGGEFPKEFKSFDIIKRWEQVLNFTEPLMWSVFSLRKASGIFSTYSDQKAQEFYIFVLLPRLRKDLKENGTLTNSHLSIMKEALARKPRAFFKGIIIPLCKTGDCTLQEAIVFRSVLENFEVGAKMCSETTLLTIAELQRYNGACSIFMTELLEEDNYLVPRIITAIVNNYINFKTEKRTVPVMWHECLLILVENYTSKLTSEYKKSLIEITSIHSHAQFTKRIQKKLREKEKEEEEEEEV